jgi:hypothetical protein
MMHIRPGDATDDYRTVMFHADAHARRLGHRHKGSEHFLLALAAIDAPAAGVLRELGVTPDRVEEEIVRRQGLGAGGALFAGLDPGALATVGVDLDAVRGRIEASFGAGALSRAGQAASQQEQPRRPSGLNPNNPRPMPPGPVDRWRQRRRARHAVPARSVAPAPPGLYHAPGKRLEGPVPLTPAAQLVLHRCMREVQVRRDAHLGAEHIALALTWVSSGPVPPILVALGAPAPVLRAAILDRYRQAS